ncbi:DMT family transporter [Oricola sp.]|uniref:DMT family transporter n=1 Tax=Oricola sp. TaxID=1979950 RepID=UPI003BACE368
MTLTRSSGAAETEASVSGSPASGSHNLMAIAFMAIAMTLFAFSDMLIKLASSDVGVGQILTIQSAISIAYFGLICWKRKERVSRAALVSAPVLIRNFGEVVGILSFVTALTLIPISNASAILQATPLALTLGAALFLKEPVGWRRWSAVAVGFAGMLIIVRPGMEGFDQASLLAVVAVFAFAARDLGTRATSASISTEMIALVASICVGLAAIVLQTTTGEWTAMQPRILAMVLTASVLGVAGFHCLLVGVRNGEVSVVAPFRYVRIIAAIGIGFVVFGEEPSIYTYAGTLLIAASGLYTLYREQIVRNRARETAQ